MESIDPECTKLKQEYETCFYSWYSEKFLKGKGSETKDDCQGLFQKYRACLERTLETKNINKMLDEHYKPSNEPSSSS